MAVRPILVFIGCALFSKGHGELRNSLSGQHLIVAAIHLPPLMEITTRSGGQVTYSGPLYSQLKWLAQRLNFSYTMIRGPKNAIGVKVNGSWDGIVGQIARNEADLAAFPFGLSLVRGEVVEHCGLFSADRSSLLTRYPTGHKSWTAVVQPFSIQAWAAWLVSLALVPSCCAIFVLLRWKYFLDVEEPISTIDDIALYLFGTMFSQGGHYRYSHQYLGIVAAAWCLLAVVFVNVYSSTLTSYLATSYKFPEINSIQELADSPTFRLVTLKGLVTENEILTAESGAYKKIGDKLRKCRECRASSGEQIGSLVLQGNYIGFMPSGSNNAVIQADYYKNNKKCSMTTAFGKAEWKFIFMGVPKSSPYKEEINRESLWAQAFGLSFKWKSFQTEFEPCALRYNSKGEEVDSNQNRLNLRQFSVAFIALFSGSLIALLFFIFELAVVRCTMLAHYTSNGQD